MKNPEQSFNSAGIGAGPRTETHKKCRNAGFEGLKPSKSEGKTRSVRFVRSYPGLSGYLIYVAQLNVCPLVLLGLGSEVPSAFIATKPLFGSLSRVPGDEGSSKSEVWINLAIVALGKDSESGKRVKPSKM